MAFGGEDERKKIFSRTENESTLSYFEIWPFLFSSYVTIPLRYGGLGMDSHLSLVLQTGVFVRVISALKLVIKNSRLTPNIIFP
jgi:hypothetical protein